MTQVHTTDMTNKKKRNWRGVSDKVAKDKSEIYNSREWKELRQEFEDAGRADNGKEYGYGKKTKGLQHRTPDSVAQDQRFNFEDWEGEHRQTDLQPPTESEVQDD